MKEIILNGNQPDSIARFIQESLGSTYDEMCGRSILQMKNAAGNGTIKKIQIDRGITLVFWDLYLNEEIKLLIKNPVNPVLLFLYLLEGNIAYKGIGALQDLKCFQNSIIANPVSSSSEFLISNGKLKVNFLLLDTGKYKQKKHYNSSDFSNHLHPYFIVKTHPEYSHFGCLNLKIADILEIIHKGFGGNLISNIAIEGHIHLLLANHLETHQDYEKQSVLPNLMTEKDVDKIYKLSHFIQENLSDKITVARLVTHTGISAKKLQHCFRMLFGFSINAYIREKKLEVALESLRNNECTISEIVYKIGWKSKSYFSRTFAEKYGMLPGEFRKRHNSIVNKGENK